MRHMSLFVVPAAVLVAAGSASAVTKTFDLSIAAFEAEVSGAERGPGTFGTGFEANGVPPYALGGLRGQNTWAASGTNNTWLTVSNASPFAGAQHARFLKDPSAAQGSLRVILGPNNGATPAGGSVTSVQTKISNINGADYEVVGQAPSQSFLTWRVHFVFANGDGSGPGNITILDDLDGPGGATTLGFIDTGFAWTPGAYKELRVEVGGAGLGAPLNYYYDNALIYTGSVGVFAGTSVEQVVFTTDNWQLAGETFDVDNISVTPIPAPGALALMGMGGLVGLRRRR
ncbi:MAG TPA: hypothetical protein VG797_05185 [Phycisphaerales bacterium]|nr:hypothetical protein [Phycisphaerales bacterium]